MEKLKSIGGVLLGISIFVGIIVASILFFTLGAGLAFIIFPFINWLAGILFAIDLIVLLIAVIPKARTVAGIILIISSYVFGIATWIMGLAVTLALWGWLAVIIGLFLGGIGVVPIGMLAAIFNGHWDIFFALLINGALTYGVLIIGALLIDNAEKHQQREEIIDVEPVDEHSPVHKHHKRSWEDLS